MEGGHRIRRLLHQRAELALRFVVHSSAIKRARQLPPLERTRVARQSRRRALAPDREQERGIEQSVQRFSDLELAEARVADQTIDVAVTVDQRQERFLL